MGGWYLQPDCNMPSGESFVRQMLLGRRYFAEKFGVAPTTAINFDPFGHTRGLVQILARSGYDSYLFCRPGQAELPAAGWAVRLGRLRRLARAGAAPVGALHLGRWARRARRWRRTCASGSRPAPDSLLWGVGDHGGGPSRQDLRDLAELIAARAQTSSILHSTPEAYFAEVRAQGATLPVHARRPQPLGGRLLHLAWCGSSRQHRRLENELYLTEKMASAAWAQGLLAYPQAELGEAMRDLATAEFHDILPGSSIQPVEEMALRLMDHGLEILSRLKARAFFALAQGQPKPPGGRDPHPGLQPAPVSRSRRLVECEFQLADQNWSGDFTAATAYQGGTPLPTQLEKEEQPQPGLAQAGRLPARLEPAQMNRFDCRLERCPRARSRRQPAGDALRFRQRARCRSSINLRTGLLDAYRVDGVDYLQPGACEPLVHGRSPTRGA